ncbi:hypothetical protein JXA32_10230 [Candidatus Sumerlaeota bacterium]|nr:hypothetical protein [Candidatus Sumerlaeota bacterium]
MAAGLRYCLEDKDIIEYAQLSAEEKLQWLEEINAFNRIALSDEAKRMHAMFLGKIPPDASSEDTS